MAILIGLSSGGLGASLTYSFNYRKERAQFLREKAEELYISLDAFSRWVAHRYIELKIVEGGGASRSQIESEHLEAAKNYRSAFSICEVYFPHIMPVMNGILEARDRLDSAIEENSKEKSHLTDKAARDFEEMCKNAKIKIARQCRRPLTAITYVRLFDNPWN